jgi:anti-anti-sigma factor
VFPERKINHPMTGLSVIVGEPRPIVQVILSGELNYLTAPQLEAQVPRVLSALERAETAWVLIDTAEIHFMDVSGVRALLACAREVTAHGGSGVALVAPETAAMGLCRWMKLDQVLPIYPNHDEALVQIAGE